MTAIRHKLTVKPDGAIEVRSPELRPGQTVEVIILVSEAHVRTDGNVSALKVASELNLEGPSDWSERFEEYLEETRKPNARA